MKALVVVDYQVDFVDGALGFPGAEKLEQIILDKIANCRSTGGQVIFTLDTHGEDYLATQEGKRLPVPHCIRGTWGHALADGLHIARFFQGLETELAALCAQWKAEQINL